MKKQKCCHCNTEFEYGKKDIRNTYIEDGITYLTGRYVVCKNEERKVMVFIDKDNR